jgi:hypothetical protein
MSFDIAAKPLGSLQWKTVSRSLALIPYQLVYVSKLAQDAPSECMPDIIRSARIKNPQRGLTGMLLFDGRRICQYLEGRLTDVVVMGGLIETDHRHTGFRVLHEGELAGPRLFSRWSMGYARIQNGDLEVLASCSGPTVVDELMRRLPAFDVDP